MISVTYYGRETGFQSGLGDIMYVDDNGRGSVDLEVFDDGFQDLDHKGASFDLPALLLGNLANARPAVLLGTQQVFHAVDVSSLIRTFLLSGLITFLVSYIVLILPSSASFSHSRMSF